MSTDGLQPVLVDQYGGLCTLIDRSDLPIGLSPDCQNVEFFPGGVRSRSGFSAYLTTTSQTTGLLPYVSTAGVRRLLVLATDGTLKVEAPETTLSVVPFSDVAVSTTALGTALKMRGTVMFGRAYFGLYRQTATITHTVGPITFYDASRLDPITGPFQYDGSTVMPVGQAGPGASFTVTPSAGGTMAAGRHDFCIVYETSTGYVTPTSDAVGDTFTAGQDCDLADVPVGPGSIGKRIVFATPANSSSFFTLPRFTLNNNSATTLSGLTFTDSELLAGTSLEDYVDRYVLGPCLGIEKYGRRMVSWGGNDALQPFWDTSRATGTPVLIGLQSLDFDGREATLPYPWVVDGALGGPAGVVTTAAGAALQVYKITGTGTDVNCGAIKQERDNYGVANVFYVQPNHSYGVRIRVRRGSVITTSGTLYVNLIATGVSSSTTLTEFRLYVRDMTTEWVVYEGTSGGFPVGTQYTGIKAYVGVTDTMTSGGEVFVDWLQIFDVTQRNSPSLLRVTPPDDPETVNPALGLIPVAENDGQVIADVFELRGNLYICKEHSLYVTTDNGDDPVNWTVDQVSKTVGTPSPHGVAVGDGWALIVSRNGLYHFTGGTPEKISQEIQTTWDSINWGCAASIWTALDTRAQRLYIGVPITTTQMDPSHILVLDYVEGFGDPIAGGGSGRKWTVWPSTFSTGAMVERDALTRTFLASGSSTRIVKYDPTTVADWTGAISSYYETAPIGSEIGRSLFDRVLLRIRGSGNLSTSKRTPGGTLTALTTKALSSAPDDDTEIRMHDNQTQVGFRIGTTGATDYWSLRRLGVFIKPSPYTYLRKT